MSSRISAVLKTWDCAEVSVVVSVASDAIVWWYTSGARFQCVGQMAHFELLVTEVKLKCTDL